MMKAILRLNLDKPEHKKELNRCLKSADYLMALDDIVQEIFRPARKHGYRDARLQELLEGKKNNSEALEKAKEELEMVAISIEDHGSEEQREYLKMLRNKIYVAEAETETSFSKGIELLEEMFWDILRERKVDLDDL